MRRLISKSSLASPKEALCFVDYAPLHFSTLSNSTFCLHVSFVLGASVAEIVPQGSNELCHRDGVGIMRDQPQNEHSILAEVLVNELFRDHLSLVLVLELVDEFQMPLDVLAPAVRLGEAENPDGQRVGGQSGDENHPEVHEKKDFLVEEVDWKNALHVVAVHRSESSNLDAQKLTNS